MAPLRPAGQPLRGADPLARLAWILGAILAVAVAALLIAPELVDWNRYRDKIALGIERRLGRAVSIDGPLSLSLLPAPHLAAEHFRIVNLRGASDPDFAQVKRLETMLEAEGAAYDIAGHRDALPGLRIWCGATVETRDVEALLPWLDWAYGEVRRALAA